MITGLVIAALTGFIVWLVRYIREGRAITRALRSFPGPLIANPTPPTRAELNGGFLIPPDRVASYAMNGSGQKVWLNEYGTLRIAQPKRTIYSPFSPRDARPGDVWHDMSGEGPMPGAHVIITTGIDPGWIPPPASLDPPPPTGCQHPNPEPVVLTTDEVVAGVCPDCLQPLPPSSVGSEWKP